MRLAWVILLTGAVVVAATASRAQVSDGGGVFCEDRGGIVSTRSGRSGRQYLCFALRQIRGGRIGNLTIHCDSPGGLITTDSGISGRRYDCYALSLQDPIRLGAKSVYCDQLQEASTARLGVSGYRYDCYVLDRPLVIDVR